MTANRSVQLKSQQRKKAKSSVNWLVGLCLGVSLLITVGNVRTVLRSINQQQLVSLQSEIFPSSDYQPIQFGSPQQIGSQDLSEIDRIAKELNYSGSSIEELAAILTENSDTETEKARMIYAWVTQHITYDVAAFLDAVHNDNYPQVNPEKVLRDRTTICSGYSNLYFALAEAMNLESVIIAGYAKGATPNEPKFQDINHAWNAVKIDHSWYLLDATWGAGSVQEEKFKPQYKPYYFGTAPKEFIQNHFPSDQGWQLLSDSYTRAEFENLPNASSRFYNLGLELVNHHNYQISTQNRVDLKFKAPQDVVAIAKLKQGTEELPETVTLANRKGDNLIINVAPPAAGSYDLKIYAKKIDDPGKYGEVINYQIATDRATSSLPKTYGHFHQHQVSLIEPLTGEIEANWSTYFNLVVPQAIDVQVVNSTTKQWTMLNGYGDYFAGNVHIQPGKTIVIAKFPGEEQYWQLVEYQSR